MIRVLIVEDSFVVRELLTYILSADPDIQVIGTASNGEEALEILEEKTPDVIVMDINMPKMNGFEATRTIMETRPVPIVIVTASWDPEEVETSFRAMEAGAVALLGKPRGVGDPHYERDAKQLVETVRLMSEVKVVKRHPYSRGKRTSAEIAAAAKSEVAKKPREIRVVAIGVSTGGPQVLQDILSRLPRDFPAPILIVQHIARGFLEGMGGWLEKTTGFPFHIPRHREYILPGHVYLAPDDHHMGVANGGRIILNKDSPENGSRPSASYLFRSVREVYGQHSAAILLTGMGRDGAEELRLLKDDGAITIIQNEESSVVFGMPGAALKLGAATHVLSPEEIAAMLKMLAQRT